MIWFQINVRCWASSWTYSWFLREEHGSVRAHTSADVCFKWVEYVLITCCRRSSASSLNFHHQQASISLLPRKNLRKGFSDNKSHQFDHQKHGWKCILRAPCTHYTIRRLLMRARWRTPNKNIKNLEASQSLLMSLGLHFSFELTETHLNAWPWADITDSFWSTAHRLWRAMKLNVSTVVSSQTVHPRFTGSRGA